MAQDTKDKDTQATAVPTVTLTIDGRQTTVPKGTTVLEAAKAMGIHIPTFCWHPKLKPMGSCRMCYVQIEKMPKLAVSCATEAMDGMVVYTDSDEVKQGRRAIIEFILMNHPRDCPTCDKGGECDLQDLTFAHGIDDSRYDFQKYRFTRDATTTFDDKRIGPEIILNRNRCILCYKCVRANKEAFVNPDDVSRPVDVGDPKWYGRIINLGEMDGHPVLTFTAEWPDSEIEPNPPARSYLVTIADGIRETYGFSHERVAEYFLDKLGVKGHLYSDTVISWIEK